MIVVDHLGEQCGEGVGFGVVEVKVGHLPNNASNFRQLYGGQQLHAGLIILIPVVNRDVQRRLFKAALNELGVIGEPINRVLEIDLDGNEVTLTLYDWPPAGS